MSSKRFSEILQLFCVRPYIFFKIFKILTNKLFLKTNQT